MRIKCTKGKILTKRETITITVAVASVAVAALTLWRSFAVVGGPRLSAVGTVNRTTPTITSAVDQPAGEESAPESAAGGERVSRKVWVESLIPRIDERRVTAADVREVVERARTDPYLSDDAANEVLVAHTVISMIGDGNAIPEEQRAPFDAVVMENVLSEHPLVRVSAIHAARGIGTHRRNDQFKWLLEALVHDPVPLVARDAADYLQKWNEHLARVSSEENERTSVP